MTPCPNCQKPVDPLRARFVGVIAGKIVAFCSAECRDRAVASGGAKVAAATRAAEVAGAAAPEPSGRKRARTPAAGVPAKRTPPAGVPVTEPPPAAAPAAAGEPARRITAAALAAAAPPGDVTAGDAPDDPSASSIRRIRRRKDSIDARAGWEWLDDEPAEPVSPRGQRGEGGGRGKVLVIAVLVVVVLGGGYVAYRYLIAPGGGGGAGSDRGAIAPADAPGPDAPAPDAAPTPEQQREAALERATGVLREHAKAAPAAPGAPAGGRPAATAQALARRMAAAALSRTGDPEAIATLAALLEKEPGESARLEISYYLARAGDLRGKSRLTAALTQAPTPDGRHEAARWLVRLGDPDGVKVLAGAMAYSQYRLQAAELLAHVAHPGALDALEAIRKDAAASPDDKARATIALGRARRARPDELLALLRDKRNAEAAAVLAELGDAKAKPFLYDQLALEHFCVEAARALRRFGDDADRAEGLRTLSSALAAAGGASAQIRAAEAILLLAGPETWSGRS